MLFDTHHLRKVFGRGSRNGAAPGSIAYLSAVRAFNCFFETTPVLLESNAAATTLLYRNVSYLWQDVVEQAGVLPPKRPCVCLAPQSTGKQPKWTFSSKIRY